MVVAAASAAFLAGLLYVYLRNHRQLRSPFTLGLVFFAALLLVQNLGSIYFYYVMSSAGQGSSVAIPMPAFPNRSMAREVAMEAAATFTRVFAMRTVMMMWSGDLFRSARTWALRPRLERRVFTFAWVMERRATSEPEKKAERRMQRKKSRT